MSDSNDDEAMKASEQIFDDSIIYVTKQGSQVRTDGGRIVVWDVDGEEGELASFPVEKLDTINVFGNIGGAVKFYSMAKQRGIKPIIGSIRNVLHNVYVFSLYQYATTGVLPDPYDSSMVPSMKTDSGREKLTEMRMCPKCGDSSFQIRDDGTAYCYNCGHSKKMELEDDKEDIRSFMD